MIPSSDGSSGSSSGPAPASPILVDVSIQTATPGITIPSSFLGISTEWGTAQNNFGAAPAPFNQTYANLIKHLTSAGNGPFIIRIGGNSVDSMTSPWFVPDADGYKIAGGIDAFARMAGATNTKFILSLTVGGTRFSSVLNDGSYDVPSSPEIAVRQAATYTAAMPAGSILAYEIGNEPDQYWAKSPPFRPARYIDGGMTGYQTDFMNWTSALTAAGNTIPYIGPSASTKNWLASAFLPAFFTSVAAPRLSFATHHKYQLSASATASDTLKAGAITEPAAAATMIAAAHAAGLKIVYDETNLISMGGKDGVSNVYGAALWALDYACSMANAGVDGLYFHASTTAFYSPILFTLAGTGADTTYTPNVQAEYYGLLVFSKLIANSARFLPVTMTTPGNVKVWAVIDNTGAVRVAILNKEESGSYTFTIDLPKTANGSLQRLTGPSVASKKGISFAGQTFDATLDGNPVGTTVTETVVPVAGKYSVTVPAASVALLTIN